MSTITDKQSIVDNCLEHTFVSWSKQGGLNPINAHTAEGVYLWDRDGKKYIDFSSQLMCVNIGHGHPRITEAVTKQMQELSYVFPGMATQVRAELGKKLAEITPEGLNKSFFTLAGADAIENAIKIARVYTGRSKVITQYRSYHGGTYAAMSAGGDPRKHAIDVQAAPNFVHIENPYFYRCPWGSETEEQCAEACAANLERVIQYENPSSIAAILLEGESGSSGCIKYPKGYWAKVRAICDKYGILLIDDEVMSGFGRTGKLFAIEHHGVRPDMMVMAKGLTSGYLPMGAVIVSDEIAAHFDENAFPCGLTYSSHAVSCAAALETIKIYEDEDLVSNAAKMGKYLESRVEEMKQKHPSIGDFRNTGLLGCIELVKDRQTKEPLVPFNASGTALEPTMKMAAIIRELGMFTFVRWNWIFMAPPLTITEAQIDEGLAIISEAISIADSYYTGK